MKRSLVGLSLLATLSLTACANASNVPPLFHASSTLQEQQQQTQSAAQLALYDYNHNINPEWNVPVSGVYDQADRYRGPNGFPLPGWSQMFFGR
jgi:hypothetical protein